MRPESVCVSECAYLPPPYPLPPPPCLLPSPVPLPCPPPPLFWPPPPSTCHEPHFPRERTRPCGPPHARSLTRAHISRLKVWEGRGAQAVRPMEYKATRSKKQIVPQTPPHNTHRATGCADHGCPIPSSPPGTLNKVLLMVSYTTHPLQPDTLGSCKTIPFHPPCLCGSQQPYPSRAPPVVLLTPAAPSTRSRRWASGLMATRSVPPPLSKITVPALLLTCTCKAVKPCQFARI